MVTQVTLYSGDVPSKVGQTTNQFDANADDWLQHWLDNEHNYNAQANEVEQLASNASNSASDSATSATLASQKVLAVQSIIDSAVQITGDLETATVAGGLREQSLENDIATAQATQLLMAGNIASANLPSVITASDAFKKMQVKSDGSGWELPEHLTLTNGQLLKGGGVYGIKTGAGFTVPLTIPDMNMIGEIRLKWYSGSLKDHPISMNLPAGTTMLGESSIEWGDENTSGLLIYKISSSEWGYELTYKTTTKVI